MGTLRRTCATAPRRGPLPKLLWADLLSLVVNICLLFKSLLFLLRPGSGAEYRDQPVCASVCVSVREHYLWNRWTDRHENFRAYPLWPWLSPPPTALRYVMYFRFYGRRHVWS